MIIFAPKFIMSQFFFEALYLIVVLGITVAMAIDTVVAAQISQGRETMMTSAPRHRKKRDPKHFPNNRRS